jgi:AraC-like DNA-binding protein
MWWVETLSTFKNHPHPNPLPAYMERGRRSNAFALNHTRPPPKLAMFLPANSVSFSAMPFQTPNPRPPVLNQLHDVPDRLHVRLLAMDGITIDQRWAYQSVRSSFWRLYFNSHRGASVHSSGVQHRLAPGCIHLLPAWLRFDCHCSREVDHLYIHFDLIGLSGAVVRQWFSQPVALAPEPLLSDLARQLKKLFAANLHERTSSITTAKALVHLTLGRLITTLPDLAQKGVWEHLAEPNPVQSALRHIETNLSESPSNSELAERCGLSEDHFIRLFRKFVGQTPAHYALERRIAAASERLLLSADTIAHIAEQTGFSNRYHFTRAFTRVIGVPPAAYRRGGRV